jgi:alanine racemase
LTVTSLKQIKDAAKAAAAAQKRARVHLKVDTGMHRLGVPTNQFIELLEEIGADQRLQLVSIFSHLAKPCDRELTQQQNDAFNDCLRSSDRDDAIFAHLASGEAARRFPFTHHSMVRVGLYLYGLEAQVVSDVVRPAMSVRARINQIRQIDAGQGVGYNFTWSAAEPARIASVPIGYADGVPRALSNKISGILRGKLVPQVGTMSMDQMLFDVTSVPEAAEEDVITLIGKDGDQEIHLADWAQKLGTLTYEMACGLRVRLPRIYIRHQDGA